MFQKKMREKFYKNINENFHQSTIVSFTCDMKCNYYCLLLLYSWCFLLDQIVLIEWWNESTNEYFREELKIKNYLYICGIIYWFLKC